MIDLPTFKAGDPVRATDLQLLSDAVGEVRDSGGGGPTSQTPDSSDFPSDPFTSIFDAEITGFGTDGIYHTWKEQTNIDRAVVDFGTPGTDGRHCDDATHVSAACEINDWRFVPSGTIVRMIEIRDGPHHRYQFVNSPPPPPLQDGSTDYILGYSKDDKAFKWYARKTCTPPDGG